METIKVEEAGEVGIGQDGDLQRALLQHQINIILQERRRRTSSKKLLDALLEDINLILKSVETVDCDGNEIMKYGKIMGVDPKEVKFPKMLQLASVSLLSHAEWSIQLRESEIKLKIQLPSESFNEKDYLQNIYVFKKYCFLKTLQKMLTNSEKTEEIKVLFLRGDFRAPVLYFRYKVDESLSEKVLLIPFIETNVFPARRFLMEQNNLRSCRDKNDCLKSTPFYNLSILRDLTLEENTRNLDSTFHSYKHNPSIQDALCLMKVSLMCLESMKILFLKVWCKSHRLNTDDGFDDITWILLLLRGIKCGQISSEGSSLSVFLGILSLIKSSKHLSKVAECSENLWIDSEDRLLKLVPTDHKPNSDSFKTLNMECFLDVTGYFNLAWDISPSWKSHLKVIAKQTIDIIQSDHPRLLKKDLFTCSLPLKAEYDSVVKTELPSVSHYSFLVHEKPYMRSRLDVIENILRQGLGNRVKIFRFFWNCFESNALDDHHLDQAIPVYISLVLSKENANRLVDKGPSPEIQEAAKDFKKFWGKKSELKKFPDGTICEAVTWALGSHHAQIPDQILDYLLNQHLGLKSDYWSLQDSQIGDLRLQELDYKKLHSASQKAAALLKDLKGIALKITSVQETDSILRKTACFPPGYHAFADDLGSKVHTEESISRCLTPIQLIANLESSGSWPVDVEAYQKTKTAILVQISTELNKQNCYSRANERFLDLFLEGFVFRIHLATERDDKAVPLKRILMEKKYHAMITQVANQHSSFPLAARLLQRWMSCQMFDCHFDPIIAEILTLSVYIQRETRPPPSTPICGFWRTLSLISNFPWGKTPLIVDLHDELKETEVKDIEQWYETQGQDYMIAVCTPFDKTSTLTQNHPSEPVLLARLIFLAKESCGGQFLKLPSAFKTNLSGFDVLLHLNKDSLSHPEQAFTLLNQHKRQKLEYMESASEASVVISHIPGELLTAFSRKQIRNQLLVGFNPAEKFFQLLEANFGFVGIFCYDRFGGDKIAIHWKSDHMLPTKEPDFTQLGYWMETGLGYFPDICGILQDIELLGKGILNKIEIL